MSVLAVGGRRFAAGLDWERDVLSRGRAARAARERGHAWMVELDGQTGFLGAAEAPGGLPPLAGALRAVLASGGAGAPAAWAAFVEEDGGNRVGVVRSAGGRILPGGESVYRSADQAHRALGGAGGQDAAVIATPGLAELFGAGAVVESGALAGAAAGLPVMVEAPKVRLTWRAGIAAALLVLAGGGAWPAWNHRDEILVFAGLKEAPPEEPPMVDAVVRSGAFLRHCRAALEAHRVTMSGWERQGAACHPRFVQARSGLSPGGLSGQAVLEVHWGLREGLDPRVHVPLAQDMLGDWRNALLDNTGTAAAFSPLPAVLARHDPEAAPWPEPAAFRRRLDRALGLRGFDIGYGQWGAEVEVELRTVRPLGEAVAMLTAVEGLEVVSAAWSREGGWVFACRRARPFRMLQSEFTALTGLPVDGTADGAAGSAG